MKKLSIILIVMILVLVGLTGTSFAEEDLTFGMVMRQSAAPFAPLIMEGAKQKCEELGIELLIRDSHNDTVLQMNHIEDYIAQDIDGFLFAGAVDQSAIIPAIKKLNEANIPIVALDSAPIGGNMTMYVCSRHEKLAEKAAKALIKVIKEENGGEIPEGVLLKIAGNPRDNVHVLCNEGFNPVIDQYEDKLKVVEKCGNWQSQDAFEVTRDLMSKYGDEVVGIYIMYDVMAVGTISAIEAAGYDPTEMSIVTQDGNYDSIQYVRNGKIDAVSIKYYFESAQLGTQILYDKIHGKKIPEPGDEIEAYGLEWEVVEGPYGVGPHMYAEPLVVPWDIDLDSIHINANRAESLGLIK